LPHRPHKLSTTLTPGQKTVAVELRRTVLLPLDDLVASLALDQERAF
jgi:hypothetical protein